MSSLFMPEVLDQEGYPAWVTALADQDDGIILHVVRGIGPTEALRRLKYPADRIHAVQLPLTEPEEPYSSRMGQALGLTDHEHVGVISAQVGEWTLAYEVSGLEREAPGRLSAGGLQGASCSVNIESDTQLIYSVNGEAQFWVTEPLTDYNLADLPDGLREAAEVSGIYDQPKRDYSWDPAKNFLAVCSLAELWQLTLNDLCRRPLIGLTMAGPVLPTWYHH